ncbi:hypothetical protein [Streptomyces sp. NPDC001508]|uniref:hypothetical protein n=1 Tax=Streptomyces sp. NPDC001508 TaxID=3154656 RepID=UPI00331F3BB9
MSSSFACSNSRDRSTAPLVRVLFLSRSAARSGFQGGVLLLERPVLLGDLLGGSGDRVPGFDAGLELLDQLFVVAVDDVASQTGLGDQLAAGDFFELLHPGLVAGAP